MGSVPLHDHPELDNHYVRCASLASDVKIMWLTIAPSMGRPALEPDALSKRLGW